MTLCYYVEREKSGYGMHEISGAEKTKHVVIGKLTAIVGHCELLELEAESQQGKERLQKITSLALDIAERVLMCDPAAAAALATCGNPVPPIGSKMIPSGREALD